MTIDELTNRFTYHKPKNETQVEKYSELRKKGLDFAQHLLKVCPESRERSLALTKIEEGVMWANASIARNE